VLVEPLLRCHGGFERIQSRIKRRTEGVAHNLEHVAAVPLYRFTKNCVVALEEIGERLRELLRQFGAAFDICEEKAYIACRE
jgi:hypothetical protein